MSAILPENRQGLKGVVTFFKTFRWAWPTPLGGPPDGGRNLVEGIDQVWWPCSGLSYIFSICGFVGLMDIPLREISRLETSILLFGIFAYSFFNILVLWSVVYWHQNDPFLLMGAKAKFMIEVIPMISAATLRTLLGFDLSHIALLLSCTIYFYIYAHFLHVAYDIGLIDFFLGIAMLLLVYMPDVELSVRALAFGFCFVLCLCRYVMYSAPEIPAHCKKELKDLPC